MTALLPQNDPGQKARQYALAQAQALYQYNHTKLAPLTLAAGVPRAEEFSLDWIFEVAQRALTVLENHSEFAGDPDEKASLLHSHSFFSGVLRSLTMDVDGLMKVLSQALGVVTISGHLDTLDEYRDMFRKIPMPAVSGDWTADANFGFMRLAGPNPMMIRRITALPVNFPVTTAQYARAIPGDTLDRALAEGRVYLADYALLDGAQDGSFPAAPKFLSAPLALFAVEPVGKAFMPVAIQCGQLPGPTTPVFTPTDGTAWLMAKSVLEVADGNYHQAITHLGRTHLFVEPFVVATHRQLADSHPLSVLLRPHFLFTIAINDLAFNKLVNTGGPVDELLAGTIDTTRGLTAKGLVGHRVDAMVPPLALRERGVDDASALPNYAYRDDSLLYWNAIRRWVGDYLAIYYSSPADLAADVELNAWMRELVAQDGGRVAGMSVEYTLSSVERLADAVAVVIFTASVQHAAVNFPQYDDMTYVPNMPLACYTPPPSKTSGYTTADLLQMLPGRRPTLLQMALGYMLGTMHFTQLGAYANGYFHDDRVEVPLKNFQTELAEVGRTVDERNKTRRLYPFLSLSGIPQSINI